MPRPEPALLRELHTARLRLEPIRREHADAMFAALRDPSLYTYETDAPPASLGALRARYAALARARAPGGMEWWLNWIAVPPACPGAPAGYVQATVERDRSVATIGYLVVTAYQRRGYGVEAVGAAVRHLAAAGVGRFEAIVDARNAASIALLERLAFVRHATFRSDDVIGGERGIDHRYVLVAEAQPAPGAKNLG